MQTIFPEIDLSSYIEVVNLHYSSDQSALSFLIRLCISGRNSLNLCYLAGEAYFVPLQVVRLHL